MGARPLRRTIQDQIEDKVTDFYLDHPQVKNFYADLSDDTIVIIKTVQKFWLEVFSQFIDHRIRGALGRAKANVDDRITWTGVTCHDDDRIFKADSLALSVNSNKKNKHNYKL